jgi:purine-nucleoside phosphorylase
MNAEPGDFAGTVLMPGDPLRAQYIADSYLEKSRRVNDVRNMWGFTGEYKGIPVSVQAHGMGIPSTSIYCTELITEYDVKRMIRVGSCGTTHAKVKLRDVVIAMGASTDSNVNRIRFGGYDLAALASYSLVQKADLFYSPDADIYKTLAKFDVLGVEMEAAGMYTIAAEHGVEALAICTVSDDIRTGKALTSDERAMTFDDMIKIALETVRMCD